MIRAVIIDDLALARASLSADVADYCPGVELVGEADGVVSGMKLILKEQPDLVFLDIHMADGEGFDILNILDDLQASIIFTTASDQHAIQAFQHDAVDYLLKPIDSDLLVKAVDKCKARRNQSSDKETVPKHSETLALSTLDDVRIVKISDIVRCESDGNYTTVFEINGHKTMVSQSLKSFEERLREYGFYRTHQSHLVQWIYVKAYLKTEGGFLLMEDESEVPVAVRKKKDVLDRLKGV